MHATCVDLTDVFGPGDPRHLRPLATEAGPLLVPIDRAAVDLVWAPSGYPSHAAYRDHHHRTARDHHPWANDGAVYDPARAAEQAASDAADFVARVAARVADGGLCVCALDTELLGVWWHEGPQWLALVVEQAARAGARARAPRRRAGRLRSRAGGRGGRPRDDVGHAPRPLDVVGRRGWPTWPGPRARPSSTCSPPAPASATARCASCWPCRAATGPSWPRPAPRATTRASAFDGHARELRAALADPGAEPALRNLAPRLARAALLEP